MRQNAIDYVLIQIFVLICTTLIKLKLTLLGMWYDQASNFIFQ